MERFIRELRRNIDYVPTLRTTSEAYAFAAARFAVIRETCQRVYFRDYVKATGYTGSYRELGHIYKSRDGYYYIIPPQR